ncbi:helix-turn-helix domain-containing protein [Erwinia sp. E602]|uniref:helix-turn-helix domain-containing protein n=1 Tax=unclassified Erwinia TaxID=2622719 RepID=UPI0006FE0B49|nr:MULTISPECIES: helix-turn-helix transcriptional regulator [unclassified Erwinia]KQN57821.1 transcriptional regulator [Erwinia sp. Leaf53]PLV58920.1 transcriptional regulator [Erwinia sp. B116]QUG77432.1 helix-turn-helix domain-containing protein [Erwinia sp. E602]
MKESHDLHAWDDVRTELLQDEETAKAYAVVLKRQELMAQFVDMRKNRNLTQNDIAKSVGVSRQAISKLEKGRASPTIDTLIGYAAAMGVDFVTPLKKVLV